MSYILAKERDQSFEELWSNSNNVKHYYVHGKDNIPFHTIILPSLLIAHGKGYRLPDEIISSEYLTLEGKKISTSQNWAIWIKDIIDRYNPDSLRYFLIANGPEKRDADFSWREYINSHNSELLGAYGNLINRSLVFIEKYFDCKVPNGTMDIQIRHQISDAYKTVGSKIEKGLFKESLDQIFTLVRNANKYFDREKPWETRITNILACENTLFNCVQMIANLSILLNPFLPFSSKKVQQWLDVSNSWKEQYISIHSLIPKTEILFEKIDKKIIDEEVERLYKSILTKA